MNYIFKPKLFVTLKNYDSRQLYKDLMAGLIVGIVALPLAIAFGIASGVSPEKGLYTAVIAGFLISALGGSRVQIGGPTGAFIVIVYGIIQQYGLNGLIISTFLAGIMLIIMGFARLGSVIKFIPHPLIIGFTSGIALIIFSSQVKDGLGLTMGTVPADFIAKWTAYSQNIQSINLSALAITLITVLIIIFWPRVTQRVPGSLIAILATTTLVHVFQLPVETIGTRFGSISSSLPTPTVPHIDFETIKVLVQPAFTIALLGGIESLLSAVVADSMIGGHHKSNMELVAQGTANIFSSLFGGIPATGAIARTATNVKNGGRTPISGITHAIVLLLIILFFGKWASLIPMSTLAGILLVVAYNMSEWRNFLSVLKGPRSDAAVLLTTFFLTVIFDLTLAIEVGMLLAIFLFMRSMIRFTGVNTLSAEKNGEEDLLPEQGIPKHIEVIEITGPLFFGAAYKFKEAVQFINRDTNVLIIRMKQVPIIDATGIKTLEEVFKELKHRGILFVLTEIQSGQVTKELRDSGLLFEIGIQNITNTFDEALQLGSAHLTNK